MKLLRGSELQFIVASLMSPDVPKDVGLSLYADVRSHDSGGMSEQGVFGEAPYPLRKAEALLRSTF